MKQNITEKQLNELSEKGKKRLRKWWKPKTGDFMISDLSDGSKSVGFVVQSELVGGTDLPLLSIGQMIEYLNDDYIPYERAKDFCDALWKLVKEKSDLI